MNRFNNLLTAIMEIDDNKTPNYSHGTIKISKSLSSSSTSTSSLYLTKKSSSFLSGIDLCVNNEYLQIGSSSETNNYQLIYHEVEALLTQLVDSLVENQEMMLVEESLVQIEIKLNDLEVKYIE